MRPSSTEGFTWFNRAPSARTYKFFNRLFISGLNQIVLKTGCAYFFQRMKYFNSTFDLRTRESLKMTFKLSQAAHSDSEEKHKKKKKKKRKRFDKKIFSTICR